MGKKGTHLTAQVLYKLRDIFKQQGWDINSDNKLFDRFCDRLGVLKFEEQMLVLELTERFTKIYAGDYMSLMLKLLDKLNKEEKKYFENIDRFFVLPLLAPKDFERTKSSSALWYDCKDDLFKYNILFNSNKLIYCDQKNFHYINNCSDKDCVILLDDYIGSGETAIDAVNHLINSYKVDSKHIIVIAIASQKNGIEKIFNETGIVVYSLYHFDKGISDYYNCEELESKIECMEGIEKHLKVKKQFRFGYNQSEALVSLKRTPNNTFPVFWLEDSNGKAAPFARNYYE